MMILDVGNNSRKFIWIILFVAYLQHFVTSHSSCCFNYYSVCYQDRAI